ncbi:DUF5700 domain-containing putative Zn-dependent protease [Silvibacterium sp.]|uniref:DUF5700 domain-containing putative Zn-dependent protease n=1 Tax=Silvibacterium sp. TaxID=1964179 RepID=UPI0039E6C5AF
MSLALALPLSASAQAAGVKVDVDSRAASAVLDALQNPSLTHEQSLRIAALPGNQGIIRKNREFKIDATTQNFADALYNGAHALPPANDQQESYFFDKVKPRARQIQALLHAIVADPTAFQQQIQKRIAAYSPADAHATLTGYIIAGGDGTGYAFGGQDFYLNLGNIEEFVYAQYVTEHELYHAVQGTYAGKRGVPSDLPSLEGMEAAEQACVKTRQLLANLYEEGSATYVGDISLLEQSHSEAGRRQFGDITEGVHHIGTSASLLEMSVSALNAPHPMPLDDVYAVGFYGHGLLYDIGYVMARDIVAQDGPEGLTKLLETSPGAFITTYTELPKYGQDKDHPALGAQTILAAKQISKGCGDIDRQ